MMLTHQQAQFLQTFDPQRAHAAIMRAQEDIRALEYQLSSGYLDPRVKYDLEQKRNDAFIFMERTASDLTAYEQLNSQAHGGHVMNNRQENWGGGYNNNRMYNNVHTANTAGAGISHRDYARNNPSANNVNEHAEIDDDVKYTSRKIRSVEAPKYNREHKQNNHRLQEPVQVVYETAPLCDPGIKFTRNDTKITYTGRASMTDILFTETELSKDLSNVINFDVVHAYNRVGGNSVYLNMLLKAKRGKYIIANICDYMPVIVKNVNDEDDAVVTDGMFYKFMSGKDFLHPSDNTEDMLENIHKPIDLLTHTYNNLNAYKKQADAGDSELYHSINAYVTKRLQQQLKIEGMDTVSFMEDYPAIISESKNEKDVMSAMLVKRALDNTNKVIHQDFNIGYASGVNYNTVKYEDYRTENLFVGETYIYTDDNVFMSYISKAMLDENVDKLNVTEVSFPALYRLFSEVINNDDWWASVSNTFILMSSFKGREIKYRVWEDSLSHEFFVEAE